MRICLWFYVTNSMVLWDRIIDETNKIRASTRVEQGEEWIEQGRIHYPWCATGKEKTRTNEPTTSRTKRPLNLVHNPRPTLLRAKVYTRPRPLQTSKVSRLNTSNGTTIKHLPMEPWSNTFLISLVVASLRSNEKKKVIVPSLVLLGFSVFVFFEWDSAI